LEKEKRKKENEMSRLENIEMNLIGRLERSQVNLNYLKIESK
jgi:hypothetical protein